MEVPQTRWFYFTYICLRTFFIFVSWSSVITLCNDLTFQDRSGPRTAAWVSCAELEERWGGGGERRRKREDHTTSAGSKNMSTFTLGSLSYTAYIFLYIIPCSSKAHFEGHTNGNVCTRLTGSKCFPYINSWVTLDPGLALCRHWQYSLPEFILWPWIYCVQCILFPNEKVHDLPETLHKKIPKFSVHCLL